MSPLVLSLLSAIIISSISLIGFAISLSRVPLTRTITSVLVSFAVGALLGDAFIHLLPESYSKIGYTNTSILAISGILFFFLMEKVVRWRHCHDPDCHDDDARAAVPLSFIGDSFHNFFDGLLLAASFSVNTHLGITTAIAIALHEIPQEIGDFGIYIHHGISLTQTLKLNLISSLFSILGVLLAFAFTTSGVQNHMEFFLPITAGGFIYLSASDLIPELHRHQTRIIHSLSQVFFITIGVGLMLSLVLIEG